MVIRARFAVTEHVKLKPRIIATDHVDWGYLHAHLDQAGVVVMRGLNEDTLVNALSTAGLMPMRQYEAVSGEQASHFELRTTPKRDGPGITPVSKPGSTKIHVDGYQFPALYRNVLIAGNSHLPDVELLHYPVVSERRYIFVHGFWAAFHALAAADVELVGELKKPQFRVDIAQYRRLDPFLSEPKAFPVMYVDELGWRFQYGGRVYAETTLARFALEMFTKYLESEDVFAFKVEPGDGVFLNQRLVAHAGIRPPADGETLLVRRLLRWKRGMRMRQEAA